ncbi:hypothetical protein QE152_g1827 [Popillia japonica]|uniref:Uncharacterized protein n=1 Tax=Popillia japonica TaxID=7064 RepID=A0AAW1N4U2_POPJA
MEKDAERREKGSGEMKRSVGSGVEEMEKEAERREKREKAGARRREGREREVESGKEREVEKKQYFPNIYYGYDRQIQIVKVKPLLDINTLPTGHSTNKF